MRRGFKKWAEDQAVSCRRDLGLQPEAPLAAAALATHLEIPIFTPHHIPGMPPPVLRQLLRTDPQSWSAVTLLVGEQALIVHNPQHSVRRQESDLMHELAHLLCSHQPVMITSIPGLPFPIREFNAEQEDEAIWLGGCLQLPRPALLWAIRRGMDTEQISQHFIASTRLVGFRRGKTGVDVEIQRGRQRWSGASQRRRM